MFEDIFFYFIKAIGVLFGIAFFIIAILSLLQFIQKTLQNFSNFKFPIIGDFLARGYRINTDKSLIKEQVKALVNKAIDQRFEDPDEPLKIASEVIVKSKTVYGMDKFYDIKMLPCSKEKILAALFIETKKSTSDLELFEQFLIGNLPLYQENIGKKPRERERRETSGSISPKDKKAKASRKKESPSDKSSTNDMKVMKDKSQNDIYYKELDYLEARYKFEVAYLIKFLELNVYNKDEK